MSGIHGHLENFTRTRQSGEKPLVSWQRWKLNGVLWFQEMRGTQEHTRRKPSSSISYPVFHTWIFVLNLATRSFDFLTCIKGIMTGPVFCAMPCALLVWTNTSFHSHHCHITLNSHSFSCQFGIKFTNWSNHLKQPRDLSWYAAKGV